MIDGSTLVKHPKKNCETDGVIAKHPLCIIDVGASGGLSPPFAGEPYINAFLFEPDSRGEAVLRSSAHDSQARVRILTSALANKKGSRRFYLARDQECSSCLEPNMDFLSRFPNPARFETIGVVEVNTETLDEQITGADPDFIKLDVQGFEAEVIDGGGWCFERATGAILEVEFEPLYQNQKLFPEVHLKMKSAGFEIFDLQRSFWKRVIDADPTRGQCVFGNALYLKPPETLLRRFANDQGKLIRAARLYHMFGYGDLLTVFSQQLRDNHALVASLAAELAADLTHDHATPVTFVRKKTHGLLIRLERLSANLRKHLLLTEQFAKCDRELGNITF